MIADFQNKATGHWISIFKGSAKGLTADHRWFVVSVAAFTDFPVHHTPSFASQRGSRGELQASYCLRTTGGPPIRFALRSTVTSTLSPILTKGMPLFIP